MELVAKRLQYKSMFIPGRSYRGPLRPLSGAGRELSKRLSNHVWMLAGDIGARSLTSAPDSLSKAAEYIEHVFRKSAYNPERQEFDVKIFTNLRREVTSGGIKFPSATHKTWNVIAEKGGSSSNSEIVVVGAHYDSVYECPAANDNGSGVAVLLEIADSLKSETLDKTVRFVAFTNEEPPFFHTEDMGSYRYALSCFEKKEPIAAMICLETIGYYSDEAGSQSFPHPLLGLALPNVGNFISFVSDFGSAALLKRCIKSFRDAVKFPSEGILLPKLVSGVSFSDHDNFWRFGYPALMVTDTANYRYPYYHDSSDTPDKLDYEKLARVTTGLTSAIRDLCR